MSAFEWSIVAVLLIGVALPIWGFRLAAAVAAKRPRAAEPSARFFAYARLLDVLKLGSGDFKIENGALWAAAIRELQKYPEYADISVLYLEEIEITGSNKFDRIMEAELKATEAYLLERGS